MTAATETTKEVFFLRKPIADIGWHDPADCRGYMRT
jgi:hypothetical protein